MEKGLVIENVVRAATRWRELGKFQKEKVTLILSPHLDDIFLSLSATILSGKLGRNVIGVNFFTASDSTVDPNAKTTFATVARVSARRMSEELGFSRMLASQGMSYLPIFLGLKEVSIDRYYTFIGSAAMGRVHKKLGSKTPAPQIYRRLAAVQSDKLGLGALLDPLFKQFGSSIGRIVAPMSVGMNNIDHGVVAQYALRNLMAKPLGLYAEIPYTYLSGNMTMDKLQSKVPTEFSEVMLTKFDPAEKARMFKKLYGSQYEKRTTDPILAIGKKLGEVIFWRK